MDHTRCNAPRVQAAIPDAQAVADRLEALYVNHYDRFVMMRPDGAIYIPKVGDRTMVLAKSNLVKHAQCEYAVSVFAGKEGSKFICFDVDQGGEERTRQVIAALEKLSVPREMIHVSFSGGKGYHVEVFFDAVVGTKHLLRLYKQVLHMIGAANHEVEFRPMSKMAIKLPLSRHHRTGNRCWFVDRSSFEPLKSVDYLFRIEQMNADTFLDVTERIPADAELPPQVLQSISDADTDIAHFDIEQMFAPLSEPGTRHQRMVRIAVYLRHCGADATACTEILTSWYEQQTDEFIKSSEQEVMREIRGIEKWVQARSFHTANANSGQVYFSLQDMQRVMSHTRRSDRQIHFMLFVLIKTWRTLSYVQMAAVTGIGRLTVADAIKRLAVSDGIEIKQGRAICHLDGSIRRKKNCYTAGDERLEISRQTEWCSERLFTLVDASAAHERFLETYYHAVHEMFGGCDLKRLLLPREYKEYLRFVQEATDGREVYDCKAQQNAMGQRRAKRLLCPSKRRRRNTWVR